MFETWLRARLMINFLMINQVLFIHLSSVTKVKEDQILDCDIEGEWDVLSNRNNEYSSRNHVHIQEHKKFSNVKHLF